MKAPKRSRQNTPEQPIRRGNSRTDAFRRHLPARTKGRRQRAGHQTFCWSHELQRSFIRLTQPKRCMRFPRMTGGKRAWRPGLLGRSIWGGLFNSPPPQICKQSHLRAAEAQRRPSGHKRFHRQHGSSSRSGGTDDSPPPPQTLTPTSSQSL